MSAPCAGFAFSCALGADAHATCWGADDAKGAPATALLQLACGRQHACGLDAKGAVQCWGGAAEPVTVPDVPPLQQLTTGDRFACGIDQGAVWCWGHDDVGQAGGNTTPHRLPGLANVVQVAAGFAHACAVGSTGKVSCWGWNVSGQLGNGSVTPEDESKPHPEPTLVSGLEHVTAITLGHAHSCALHANGGVSCWGDGSNGQLGDGGRANRATPVRVEGLDALEVAAGSDRTCAIRRDGRVVCWGLNDEHVLKDDVGTVLAIPTELTF